jgi:ubiquinone/menaquinone biosynthesis C-methylase UbiE
MLQDRLVEREEALRSWFVRNCDPVRAEIDGLDVGWGGVQRWITSVLPLETSRRHLDFACGYATFVAQLAWRFPQLRIVGLNIDFEGPHALAEELVAQAGAADRCEFVRADAREMPLPTESFDSASCFLGLQDIEIGFGEEGVRGALAEAVRILKRGGILAVADECPIERLQRLLDPLPLNALRFGQRELSVGWSRDVAERAIELYADGWEAQVRSDDPNARAEARAETLARMRKEVERQLTDRGFYVPFGPIRLAIARKTGG